MKIGYAHVLTEDQNLRMRAGVSGYGVRSQFEPEGAGGCPNACTAGDVLTVWKLDRLGRSLLDLVGLVGLVGALKTRDIGLKVLTSDGYRLGI